jgi:Ni,Fe-hydrogenase III large subunit
MDRCILGLKICVDLRGKMSVTKLSIRTPTNSNCSTFDCAQELMLTSVIYSRITCAQSFNTCTCCSELVCVTYDLGRLHPASYTQTI